MASDIISQHSGSAAYQFQENRIRNLEDEEARLVAQYNQIYNTPKKEIHKHRQMHLSPGYVEKNVFGPTLSTQKGEPPQLLS